MRRRTSRPASCSATPCRAIPGFRAPCSPSARDWTRILTDGKGIFCTSQQEDNAIYEALKRGAGAKLLDLDRVAVLRAGSGFLPPYDGQSSADNLVHYAAQGGFPIALENLYRTASPLVREIVNNWPTWRRGVPAH